MKRSPIPILMAAGVVAVLLWLNYHPQKPTERVYDPIYTMPLDYKQADNVNCDVSSPGEGSCTNPKTKITYHFCDYDTTKACPND